MSLSIGAVKFARRLITTYHESDTGTRGRGADVLLHGLLRRPRGLPAERLENLAVLLPGFHGPFRADERQFPVFQQNVFDGMRHQYALAYPAYRGTMTRFRIEMSTLCRIPLLSLSP